LEADDIRVFLPSKDYESSKEFYTDLGFLGERVTDDLTIFENGNCTFFLQNFYKQQHAENLMLQLCVSNIDAAYLCAQSARHKQKVSSIEHEPWGKVFYLWGPSGELWHVTELARSQ